MPFVASVQRHCVVVVAGSTKHISHHVTDENKPRAEHCAVGFTILASEEYGFAKYGYSWEYYLKWRHEARKRKTGGSLDPMAGAIKPNWTDLTLWAVIAGTRAATRPGVDPLVSRRSIVHTLWRIDASFGYIRCRFQASLPSPSRSGRVPRTRCASR